MIKKNDLILLLTQLQEEGLDVDGLVLKTINSTTIPMDVLKFINDNRQLDVAAFYELLRKNYNKKKSNLYLNIVKEIEEPQEVITTLCALLTQVVLFSKKLDNSKVFLDWIRAEEISRVLNIYFKTFDISLPIKLLKILKTDIKIFEELK